ncbi:beta-ketoacyl synthase N-terminal-like domain-containing protein [Siccirubricoccus deserti]
MAGGGLRARWPDAAGATRAARSALVVAREAWAQAGLQEPAAVGLVVAGHNLSLAETAETLLAQQGRMGFAPPRHALQVWDSHVLGVLSEALGCTGPGMLAGGHFSSGITALAQAAMWLRAGEAEVALCVAPCAALSTLEWQAFVNLGAADPGVTMDRPGAAALPALRTGAGGLRARRGGSLRCPGNRRPRQGRGGRPLARLGAARLAMAGRAGPEPDAANEARVIRAALQAAGLAADAVGYINAHATGAAAGDMAEAEAIRAVFGGGAGAPWVNATKAITGHGLFAAGLVGLVATVLHARRLPARDPGIGASPAGLRLVGRHSEPHDGSAALCNAFGFDGLNGCALILNSTENR